jgi:hypothetical protein
VFKLWLEGRFCSLFVQDYCFQWSYQTHRRDCITPSRDYLDISHYTRGGVHAPGRRNETSSSLLHNTWRFKSTKALWTCMTSCSRSNSPVILASCG